MVLLIRKPIDVVQPMQASHSNVTVIRKPKLEYWTGALNRKSESTSAIAR